MVAGGRRSAGAGGLMYDDKDIEKTMTDNTLKIIPLGGMGEIGKNMTAVEYRGKIVVVDCGLAFPRDEMLGIDLVLPDISYLRERRDDVLGVPHHARPRGPLRRAAVRAARHQRAGLRAAASRWPSPSRSSTSTACSRSSS